MAMPERMHPDCPPDAHKVIRPPENELRALLCVRVEQAEIDAHGAQAVAAILSYMSKEPLLWCEDGVWEALQPFHQEAEIAPARIRVAGGNASIRYAGGAVSEEMPFHPLSEDVGNYDRFLDLLGERCIISSNLMSMLILRSISTVYPWDRLLAGDFVRQYQRAYRALTPRDIEIFNEIRYEGRDAYASKKEFPVAYEYLRIERKLFLQYPSDED
ncbi:MAG: hypothetical protein K6A65_01845 [Succinivibrionaceae bacterium]|nr:hypothetical protein [Succinivibrionaceae bacterium]